MRRATRIISKRKKTRRFKKGRDPKGETKGVGYPFSAASSNALGCHSDA